MIPTSNHNKVGEAQVRQLLFISWFLHQTTTIGTLRSSFYCCLSLDSYIKPQQRWHRKVFPKSCLSLDSYIKPQLMVKPLPLQAVVYLLIPTSNHNWLIIMMEISLLFISWFLHQTTTPFTYTKPFCKLFISWFLHQTTTCDAYANDIQQLFISWFLHQTTTTGRDFPAYNGCLSLDSYIKPQLLPDALLESVVVYLLIPTSNHNCFHLCKWLSQLFISWFLHQTTTPVAGSV